ncbi:hypothetical protein M1146_02150 [Patescibacteria group bacterium]|nr:hypothetical protein [Patescibacteria group bacterium]
MENKFKIFLINIWPTIYRVINAVIYFVISLIKGIVTLAIKQIKGGGEI